MRLLGWLRRAISPAPPPEAAPPTAAGAPPRAGPEQPTGTTPPSGAEARTGGAAPGPLSLLLRELAQAPEDDLLQAWTQGLRPGDVVGRFEILREVGRGGFGVVYGALDLELGREVAIKTLRPARSRHELAADWIHREAEAVAQLDHPAIVVLFEVGSCPSGPYLVEELLHGEPLDERLRAGPMAAGEALEVALQVAGGLAHAHGRGLLHRDLKAGNVFLTDQGRVKLLDFGLSHLLGTRGQPTGGTPAYMAPEQARGEPIGPAADVYALGVVLFEMVAGRRPFDVKDGRSAALERGPAHPLPPGLPAPLSSLVRRCLSLDPADRPENGRAVLAELLEVRRALDRPRPVSRSTGLVAGSLVLALAGWLAWRNGFLDQPSWSSTPSVAVLPFADMSPLRDQGHLSDGTAEEILMALSRLHGLRVAGRTSSFSFRDRPDDLRTIGRKLDVATVVEGSIRKSGDRVRVAAQLVAVNGGHRLWSEEFDRELGDVFAVQEEIARAVAAALQVKLLPGSETRTLRPPTASPEAYDQYLRGRQLAGRLDYLGALVPLRKALALDPAFASAWAWLASCLLGEPELGRDTPAGAELRKGALEAADRAVALDPELADGYAVRGNLRRILRWDWEGARIDLDRALALEPRSARALGAQAMLLAELGSHDQAVAVGKRLVDIEPLSALAWGWLGAAHLGGGRIDLARKAYLRALEVAPESPMLGDVMVLLDLLEGKAAAAAAGARRLGDESTRLFFAALTEHDLGHPEPSEVALQAYRRTAGGAEPVALAQIHAWRGEGDLAFEWLEQALARHAFELEGVKGDPLLRRLHPDPRWKGLLRRMRLPAD